MNNETTAPKGITALIYRDALDTDFSNRGISARVMEVTVIGKGIDPVFEATEERPAVRLVKNEHFHRETVIHAEPVAPEGEPAPWCMAGGRRRQAFAGGAVGLFRGRGERQARGARPGLRCAATS